MAPPPAGRLRLAALCAAVAGRAAAFTAVSILCLTLLQGGDFAGYRPTTLAAWLGLSAVPALVLAAFIGPLVGSGWNRAVLVAGSVVVVAVLAWAKAESDVPWLSVVGLLALELAFFGAAVVSLGSSVPEVSPTTARFWLVLSAAAGVWFVTVSHFVIRVGPPTLALGCAVGSLVAVLLGNFRPAEPVALAQGIVKPFLAGARDAVAHRRARHALVGLWLWVFVALAAVTALVRFAAPNDHFDDQGIDRISRHFALALVVGVLVTSLNRHPYRHAGFVLYGALVAVGSLLCYRFWDSGPNPVIGLGFALGLSISPLVNFYLTWTTPRHHGVAAALALAGGSATALILTALMVNLGDSVAGRTSLAYILLVVTVVATGASLAAFFRPAMEITAEALLWPVYRVHGVGPGFDRLPTRGPYLVIGNHAGWFDPLFLAKVVPAPVVPMMTSKFYDLPVLSWLMRHVVGTIRVPDKPVRHEAPELKEAVAALDRGECVVLFPEGYLRRKEEVPLRRFGRGVWQILKDRPQTPVFACWIEGVWGSYLSYRGGPPARGKRPDFWAPIRVSVTGPIAVDAATLGDHMATRTFLMRQVSEARRPLGLEPLALPAVHDGEGDKE